MLYSFEKYSPDIDKSVFVAQDAVLIGNVSIGKNSSIWFKTVIRADINEIKIGEGTNIQDGCLLHVTKNHFISIGSRVTVGHGAILHGCKIEDDCLIAMGAIILDGVHIGSNCLIAAGSLLTPNSQIPANSLVMGSPAKVIRQITELDREKIIAGWKNYVDYAQKYKNTSLFSEH
jgi:carbonic anhydrase/acetyltransferase-like protein (isoleucine patch superfamily)